MKTPDAKAAVEAWQKKKVRSKKEVIKEAQKNKNNLHITSLTDLCHHKNAELEPQFQKYKGRVVVRGDIVKDNSGSCAVFTEQGSSASQMTAAKITDIISRLPGCDGQAADAVSACTRKIGRCSQIIEKFPNRNVRIFGYVSQDTSGRNHCPVWKTQSFLLSEICPVILWQD